MARIALLMQDFSGGGAERMMINVGEGLATRGHEVEIVTVRPEGPYRDRVPPHIPIVALGPRRVSHAIPALARYLRQRRPDAALSTLVHMNVAAVLAKRIGGAPTRLVLREANRISEDSRAEPRPLIRLAYRLLPVVYSWADHVIGVSEEVAAEVRQLSSLPTERVTAVKNPVLAPCDLAAIAASTTPPHPWFEEGIPVVLAIGRLAPQKDHLTLLEAFARVRQERPARLIIVGRGDLKEALRQRGGELGIAKSMLLAGFQSEPFAWLKGAAVLAHTSRWEGSPNVVVEALACGVPVVATDCPGGPRPILDGGRYGELVPVGDVQAVASALARALDERPDRASLWRRAAEFTVEAVIPQYEAILLGAAAPSHGWANR
jgi:glycosyltransferase involved in cell wall biosynthesis